MSASITTSSPTSTYTTPAFWERLWRAGGIQSLGCFIIAYIIYGAQPQVGASADILVAFYQGDHVRILIAAVFYGLAVLNLMWFAAAIAGSGNQMLTSGLNVRMGRFRVDFVPARDAYHGLGVWALAG